MKLALWLTHFFAFILPFLSFSVLQALVYKELLLPQWSFRAQRACKKWSHDALRATWLHPSHDLSMSHWASGQRSTGPPLEALPFREYSQRNLRTLIRSWAPLELTKWREPVWSSRKVCVATFLDTLLETITSSWPFISLFQENRFLWHSTFPVPYSFRQQELFWSKNILKHHKKIPTCW